jgi:hypothetical protein
MTLLDELLSETLSEPNYYLNARAGLQEDYSWKDRNCLAAGRSPYSIILDVKNRHAVIPKRERVC